MGATMCKQQRFVHIDMRLFYKQVKATCSTLKRSSFQWVVSGVDPLPSLTLTQAAT